MIDFLRINEYKENNRIEAKRALGGLPHSIWETYSAFANTYGGVILLGVEELPDHSFSPIDLPCPEMLIEDFWELVNDKRVVSANILEEDDVVVENIDGKHIVVIRVPEANREEKPVYIFGDKLTGTYFRNGEGDYKVPVNEIDRMFS